MKLCECGCGEPAPIAKRTNKKLGHVAGEPVRFVRGHHNKVRKKRPLKERFWEKVDKRGPDECWEWQGYRDVHGYGFIHVSGLDNTTSERAHRISYRLHHGSTDGLTICHTCDNPPCVNPAHLFAGTQGDNIRDMWDKGRGVEPPPNIARGERQGRAVFTNAEVRALRDEFAAVNLSVSKFARSRGVAVATMWRILRGITYQDV